MNTLLKISKVPILALSLGLGLAFHSSAHATMFTQIPFVWEHFDQTALDDSNDCDDCNFGNVALGFSVTLGGQMFDAFDMDSNGYVQLLSGTQSPENYGYGSISGLTGADPTATYLLAAYDDLSSSSYGYYGYVLESARAVFYYNTETYDDDDDELLNEFEMILLSDGTVQWNFNFADYSGYDDDLFSGLYFGNTGELHELYSDFIPEEESWVYAAGETVQPVPEPATLFLVGSGLIGLVLAKRKPKAALRS